MSGLSESVQVRILDWYDLEARDLPWRSNPDPWAVLVSEFVLQQTQMVVGLAHWYRMMERFPTIKSMATSSVDDVLEAWQGCGYYARARNLHALAVEIASRDPPLLPSNPQDLQDLPGIGPYTAAAVSSIAFDYPVAAVDGNIRRVHARILAEERPKNRNIQMWADESLYQSRPGDWNQALMELGATICTPRRPSCGKCPAEQICLAASTGEPTRFPESRKRLSKKIEGHALVIRTPFGIHLTQREGSRLGGLWGVPITENPEGLHVLCENHDVENHRSVGKVRHTFSHREWHLQVWVAERSEGGIDPTSVPISRLDERILETAGWVRA